jgi:predicted nucleic-acid-binding protein
MIGLDTNVIVRYLAQDDAEQTRAATRLIETLTPEAPGFITAVVVAETVWVMEDLYDASRAEIAVILEKLLQTGAFVFQDAEILWRALARYRMGRADFADYLIERTCAAANCDATFTFDKKAVREDCGMQLVR